MNKLIGKSIHVCPFCAKRELKQLIIWINVNISTMVAFDHYLNIFILSMFGLNQIINRVFQESHCLVSSCKLPGIFKC